MFKSYASVFLLSVLIIFDNVNSLCVNKDALNNITAVAYQTKSAKGYKYNGNFHLLEKFEGIHMTNGNVTELCEDMIKDFSLLKTLTMINVNISNIQQNAFVGAPNLIELSLSVNNLEKLDNGIFNKLRYLETLYLAANKLIKLEKEVFFTTPNLKKLYLNRNELRTLDPDLFKNSKKLELIDLSFNLFEIISPSNFPMLPPNVKGTVSFLLGKNNIREVDPEVFSYTVPIHLNLSRNKLNVLSDLYYKLSENSRLILDSNQFNCVSDDVLEDFKKTTKIVSLQNNPLSCDCIDNIRKYLDGDNDNSGYLNYSSTFPCSFIQQISFE